MDREAWPGVLETEARKAGIPLSPEQVEAFETFRAELLAWNERINLTSITGDQEFAVKHLLDSMMCLRVAQLGCGRSVVDVGSGGGFPGIPLAIAAPGTRVCLLESVGKKAEFLRHAVGVLGLDAEVLCMRAEEAGGEKGLREQFDVVVSRAVAEARVLAEYCLPLCRVGGLFIAMKGPEVSCEVAAAGRAVERLGGTVRAVVPYELPFGMGGRTLVVVDKVRHTPREYPRRPGVAAKKPL